MWIFWRVSIICWKINLSFSLTWSSCFYKFGLWKFAVSVHDQWLLLCNLFTDLGGDQAHREAQGFRMDSGTIRFRCITCVSRLFCSLFYTFHLDESFLALGRMLLWHQEGDDDDDDFLCPKACPIGLGMRWVKWLTVAFITNNIRTHYCQITWEETYSYSITTPLQHTHP